MSGNEDIENEVESDSDNPDDGERFHDSDYELDDDEDLDDLFGERKNQWSRVFDKMEVTRGALELVIDDGAESDLDWVEPGDEVETEELHSQTSSDSEGENVNKEKIKSHKRFHMPEGNVDVFFEVGQEFATRKEFQLACMHHGTVEHRRIQFKRTNPKRCTAHCLTSEKCQWMANINYRKVTKRWEMTSLQRNHACRPTFNHGCTNYKYLCEKYKDDLRIMPDMKVSHLIEKAQRDLCISISRGKAFNARKLAISQIEGDLKQQYDILQDYCNELLRSNPNSTVLLQTEDNPGGKPLFHRIYVCLDACIKGFQERYKSLIGIDGCHLRGSQKGILLAAIGIDANDQIFPVSYAVVEIENKSAWLWFLTAIGIDANICECFNRVILQARDKPIITMLEALRFYLMDRLQKKRVFLEKCKANLDPR